MCAHCESSSNSYCESFREKAYFTHLEGSSWHNGDLPDNPVNPNSPNSPAVPSQVEANPPEKQKQPLYKYILCYYEVFMLLVVTLMVCANFIHKELISDPNVRTGKPF